MTPTVSFLEDQSVAIAVWRSGHDDKSKPLVLAGVQDCLHLYSEELDVIDTVSVGSNTRISRIVMMGSDYSSAFFACTDGSLGFQTIGSTQLGKLDQLASPTAETKRDVCIDADIHRTGHLASLLFSGSASSSSLALIDTQRDSVMGKIPLGQTGTPNGVRIVDNSLLAVGSAVVSLYDLRAPQAKAGIASQVLDCGTSEARGRIYTSIESDGAGTVLAGDSSGGLWLWDARNAGTVVKSVHAHAGAVLSMSLGGGVVGSTSADGSVSLWTVVNDQALPAKKKSRKLLLDLGAETGGLKRAGVEGSGAAICISVESLLGFADKKLAYATETGVLVLSSFSEFQ